MSTLPFDITLSRSDINYSHFITRRSLGDKHCQDSNYQITSGDKWYLIMSQVYVTASRCILSWYDGSYIPDTNEIPILIRGERLLSLKETPKTVENAIRMGYKDVLLHFLRKNLQDLRNRTDKLKQVYDYPFNSLEEIARLLMVNIETVDQY